MTGTDLTLRDFDYAALAADVGVSTMKVDADLPTTTSREPAEDA